MEMDKGKRNCVIRYIILFIVFASVAFGLYAFFSAEKGTDYTPPVTPVETAIVAQAAFLLAFGT